MRRGSTCDTCRAQPTGLRDFSHRRLRGCGVCSSRLACVADFATIRVAARRRPDVAWTKAAGRQQDHPRLSRDVAGDRVRVHGAFDADDEPWRRALAPHADRVHGPGRAGRCGVHARRAAEFIRETAARHPTRRGCRRTARAARLLRRRSDRLRGRCACRVDARRARSARDHCLRLGRGLGGARPVQRADVPAGWESEAGVTPAATLDARESRATAANQIVVSLAVACDERLACGKARNLARLIGLGVPVPGGIVLTCHAFDALLSAAALRERIAEHLAPLQDPNDLAALTRASGAIRALIMASPFPPDVHAALRDGERGLAAGTVAVRSSAVGEDGARSSFAGQFDSVLGVETRDALHQAVRTCWASYWSERALFYRLTRPPSPQSFGATDQVAAGGMAIVIQQQVPAVVAGVLFTRIPADHGTDSDDMVLEYCAGLADRLVTGQVDPERLFLSRSSFSITREERPGDCDPAVRPALHPRCLLDLGRLALRLEREFGGP